MDYKRCKVCGEGLISPDDVCDDCLARWDDEYNTYWDWHCDECFAEYPNHEIYCSEHIDNDNVTYLTEYYTDEDELYYDVEFDEDDISFYEEI